MSRFSFLRSNRQAPASGKARSDYVADQDFDAVAAAPRRGGKQKDAADPALPEKKRARRRLVGAITLTLTAAIVLPLAFDPEPKPLAQDVAIDVSSRTKTAQPAKAAAPVPAPEPEAAASSPSAATVAAVAGTTAVAAAGTAIAAAPKKESKPAEPATKPAAKPAAETKAAASEQSKYIIQVAALASQQKVNELQAKLKSAGIKSHTQKVATQNGERIRVRVGPMGSRKEADSICAKLGKIGQQCTIFPA